jgi:hypothetical protein
LQVWFELFSFEGMESDVAWDGAFRLRFCLFLSRLAGNRVGPEGAGRLAEPLGKLTALQWLYIDCAFPTPPFPDGTERFAWDVAFA